LILRETPKLPRSKGHQHKQSDGDNAQSSALRIEYQLCLETNERQRNRPASNSMGGQLSSNVSLTIELNAAHHLPLHPFLVGFA